MSLIDGINNTRAAMGMVKVIQKMCPHCRNRIIRELRRKGNARVVAEKALDFVCDNCKKLIEDETRKMVEKMGSEVE